MIIKLTEDKKLDEATIGEVTDQEIEKQEKQMADKLEADVFSGEGMIEGALSRSLKIAQRNKKIGRDNDYPNILFVGEAGCGKSARIRAWAQKNNVHLVTIQASTMDTTDLGGAIVPYEDIVKRLASTEFDVLENENSVLFLDEFNRAPREVRGTLLTLIQDHLVPDSRTNTGQRKLKNFLFTVAAINPASADYNTDELDVAEYSRFRLLHVGMEKSVYIGYINDLIDSTLKNPYVQSDEEYRLELIRKKELVNLIIPNKLFKFDDKQSQQDMISRYGPHSPTNARSFTLLLKSCNGTKADFLDQWDDFCNPDQKRTIENILKDYKDVDDKATQALAGHETESTVFKSKEGSLDKFDRLSRLTR